MNDIKHRIRDLRKQHGLTIAEFAKSIQVSAGNVGDWESIKRTSVPGAQALIAISKAYNVSIDWLLLGEKHDSYQIESPYSEYIKPKYAAHPRLFIELVEHSLRLSEDELEQLVQSLRTHNSSHIG